MHKIVAESDKDTDLPAEVNLGMPLESAWAIWTAVRAGKGRFLPYSGSLMDQPDNVMNAIFRLDTYFEKVQAQYLESKKAETTHD